MGICLNMIVKDESKHLPGLFESLHSYIDYYVISDTGSHDDTIPLIESLGKKYGIAGLVQQDTWRDFSTNRQLALDAAVQSKLQGLHHCNWLMIIDADEELTVDETNWKEKLEAGYSYTTYKKLDGLTYKHLFLLWINEHSWQWMGKVHNYLVNSNGNYPKKHVHEIHIRSYHGVKSEMHIFKDPVAKGRHYIRELQEELAPGNMNKSNVHRYFQLASTYIDINEPESAIPLLENIAGLEYTSKDMRYISLVFQGKCMLRINLNPGEIASAFRKAISLDPDRKEAYYYLAVLERTAGHLSDARTMLLKGLHTSAISPDLNVWEEDIYTWRMKFELAFLHFQLKEFHSSKLIVEELILSGLVPEPEHSFLLALKKKFDPDIHLDL